MGSDRKKKKKGGKLRPGKGLPLDDKWLAKLKKRGASEAIEVRESAIHGSGVYAARDLVAEERIVEYVGELIPKEVSEKRAQAQAAKAAASGEAAVYIFNLSKKWDLDGSFDWNPARLINHSCDPNCEAFTEGKRIFIYAKRAIQAGEELTFDYGFELETYADHPCLCGAENCVGYIVGSDYRDDLEALITREEKATA
ncbi:MAG: SET domain-containing protein [Verrucomicrobiales bacterium]